MLKVNLKGLAYNPGPRLLPLTKTKGYKRETIIRGGRWICFFICIFLCIFIALKYTCGGRKKMGVSWGKCWLAVEICLDSLSPHDTWPLGYICIWLCPPKWPQIPRWGGEWGLKFSLLSAYMCVPWDRASSTQEKGCPEKVAEWAWGCFKGLPIKFQNITL